MKRNIITTIGCLALLAGSAGAATLISTNFDSGSLSPWTVSATTNTGLYQHNTLLQPADTVNYATSGDYAVSLAKSGGTMTSGSFDLSAGGAGESITISLATQWINATSTRRAFVETSLDGGTNWFRLATLQQDTGAGSLTFTEGSSTVTRSGSMRNPIGGTAWNGPAFSDETVFRIVNEASAGADVRVFVDDTVITTTVVPEPSAALLGGVGMLLLLRRRR